jgi:hypothetical protein
MAPGATSIFHFLLGGRSARRFARHVAAHLGGRLRSVKFGGSSRPRAATAPPYIWWVVQRATVGKIGRKPVVSWLTLVAKTNQFATNSWPANSRLLRRSSPKQAPSTRRAPLFPIVGKSHRPYSVRRPMRHPESEEVPDTHGPIHISCEGRFRGQRRRVLNWNPYWGAEDQRYWLTGGDKGPLGRNSRPILFIGWKRCRSILFA